MIEQYTSPVAVNNSQEPWLVGEGVVVSGGVAIPSLDFNFITGGLPGTVTFTRASTATYFDSAGVLQSAAIDTPRFDYDPSTLAARGFLIEEQRTNLLTYSEDLTQSAWTTNSVAVTPTANQAIAPDGNTTADIVVPTAVSSTHILRQFASVTSGTTYSGSWFVKAAGYTFCQVTLSTGFDGGGALYRNFNLSTGANGNGNLPASQTTISSVGNGWYRITVTAASTLTTASGRFNLNILDADTASANPTYTGDGTSGLYIWGAQLEAGAFPTSYIPTTTTALTRSADVASVNTLSPWFNATEGTFYIEATALWTLPQSAVILTVNNNTLASQLRLFLRAASSPTNNRLSLYYSTTSIISNMPSTPAANSTSKMAFNYNDPADTAEGTRDGLATTSGAWTGTLSAASVVDIGQGYSDLNQLCGWIRRITYYPRALSSAELQSITA